MSKWQVDLFIETTYHVEADSEEEAIAKAEAGEAEEVEYGAVNQVMSAEEV